MGRCKCALIIEYIGSSKNVDRFQMRSSWLSSKFNISVFDRFVRNKNIMKIEPNNNRSSHQFVNRKSTNSCRTSCHPIPYSIGIWTWSKILRNALILSSLDETWLVLDCFIFNRKTDSHWIFFPLKSSVELAEPKMIRSKTRIDKNNEHLTLDELTLNKNNWTFSNLLWTINFCWRTDRNSCHVNDLSSITARVEKYSNECVWSIEHSSAFQQSIRISKSFSELSDHLLKHRFKIIYQSSYHKYPMD